MKVLFIANYNIEKKADGVAKKISQQISAFKQLGFDVDYFKRTDKETFFYDGNDHLLAENLASFHKTWDNALFSFLKLKKYDYDFLYIRYDYISYKFLSFLKKIKKYVPKILLEVPTVMGKPEPNSSYLIKTAFYFKKHIEKKLVKYVDNVITYSDDEVLFGIKTICIENGINAKLIDTGFCKFDGLKLNIIGVAMMTPSHGFDRVIKGIKEYYDNGGKVDVCFNIVGDGSSRAEWEELVKKLDLQNHVFFKGLMHGDELNECFKSSSFAVASLAIFRKKTTKCSELKIREYFARGIPFIYSAYEPKISKYNDVYCLQAAHDESSIDINRIIDFLSKRDFNQDDSNKMHEIALNEMSWESQIDILTKKAGIKHD